MGILDNLEQHLERAVNGAFAKTFRSSLQPLEVSSALKNELDTHTNILSRDRVIVPNELTAGVNPQDYERLSQLGQTLIDDLRDDVQQYAAKQGFSFAGPLVISVEPDDKVGVGMVSIASGNGSQNVVLSATFRVAGRMWRLSPGRTVIGRSTQATIVLDDPSVSKQHAAITWNGTDAAIEDLGSTNGTFVDGAHISRAKLTSPATIRLGAANADFRITPTVQR